MRTTFGYTVYNSPEGTASGFNLNGFDLLSAGVLHKNISFLLIYTPRIDMPASSFLGPDSLNSNASQRGSLESVSFITLLSWPLVGSEYCYAFGIHLSCNWQSRQVK